MIGRSCIQEGKRVRVTKAKGRDVICVLLCTSGLADLCNIIGCSPSTVPIQSPYLAKFRSSIRKCFYWGCLAMWLVWSWDTQISQNAFSIKQHQWWEKLTTVTYHYRNASVLLVIIISSNVWNGTEVLICFSHSYCCLNFRSVLIWKSKLLEMWPWRFLISVPVLYTKNIY